MNNMRVDLPLIFSATSGLLLAAAFHALGALALISAVFYGGAAACAWAAAVMAQRRLLLSDEAKRVVYVTGGQ